MSRDITISHRGPGLGKVPDATAHRLSEASRPRGLEEIQTLSRTLGKRDTDILAYSDRIGSSNNFTEAINGRPEQSP